MITGKTLIDLGYTPGKWFATAIAYANAQELTGAALTTYLDAHQPVSIEPHAEPLTYHRNLRAETEAETQNVADVFTTMDVLMR
ncbi:MAG: RNA-splicing ligase RtcB, partial [Bacteroidota bacterium]